MGEIAETIIMVGLAGASAGCIVHAASTVEYTTVRWIYGGLGITFLGLSMMIASKRS